MAITYHAGRRIQGLSTDYIGTSDWTTSNSSSIGISGNEITIQERNGDYDEVAYKSFTALGADASFTFRFPIKITTIDQTGGTDSIRVVMGVSSASDIADSTARDEVGIIWRVTNSINKFYAFTADGTALTSHYSGTDFATTPSTTGGDGNGNYYVEISGSGGTYTFKLFSDPTYDTLIESESITDAGITGLQYYVFRTWELATHSNQARATVTISTKPTDVQVGSRFEETDTRKMYHYNEQVPNLDYKSFPSDYAGWTKSPNDATKVEFSSNRANLSIGEASVDARAYGYDIGVDLDGDYCMDFELTMTNTPNNAGGGSATNFGMGLAVATSDVNGEAPSGYNEMWKLGGYTASGSSGYTYVYVTSRNSGGTTAGGSDANTSFPMPSSATNLRYGRMTRSGTTHRIQFFSDSARATTATTDFTATVVVQTLRYIFIKAFSQAQSPAWTGYLDNIKIYKDSIVPLTGNIWSEEGT